MFNSRYFLFLLLFISVHFSGLSQKQSINQTDNAGNRHGKWIEYYDDAQEIIKFEGEFIHGKETGLFKFYQEGLRQPAAIMVFDTATDTVHAKFLSQSGKTISEGKMIDQQRTGLWTYFHKNSNKVMMTETYKNGKLEGVKTTFYPNGQIAEEANYLNGEFHGSRKLYSEKGVVLEDLQYNRGELHGPAKFYNGKGEIMSEGRYKNNKHHGTWRYYENGNLVREKDY